MNPFTKLGGMFRRPEPVLDPIGGERVFEAQLAVHAAERRLRRLHELDPHTAGEYQTIAEPDWNGETPTAEELERWAHVLNSSADRQETEIAAAVAAQAAQAALVDSQARGMTFAEAGQVLRENEAVTFRSGLPTPDSPRVAAARRVMVDGADVAISRTQPLPVVPARLGAARDRDDAEQDNDGQDSAGTSADVVAPTVRGRLLEHARWAYEHAEQIDREASQARERGDFSGASEWSCRALGLRDSAREFERGARELGPDAVPPATVQALAESLDQARQHHEWAMQIEREQDQAGQRGQYREFFDTRGCQALGLRDSAREFERDARTSTGPRTDQATTGGFGFVALPQRAGAAGAAVESAQAAVNNLSAQPTTTSERAQTGRWAGDEHSDQHGADYGAEYGGGLSADGRGVGW